MKESNWAFDIENMTCLNVYKKQSFEIKYQNGHLYYKSWNGGWGKLIPSIRKEYLRVREIETEKILLGADSE